MAAALLLAHILWVRQRGWKQPLIWLVDMDMDMHMKRNMHMDMHMKRNMHMDRNVRVISVGKSSRKVPGDKGKLKRV